MQDKKEETIAQLPFNKDISVEERASKYWLLFTEYQENRDVCPRFLNKNGVDRNILDYVEDSVDRMNERKLKPSYKEDWQANIFEPITRNKTIFILGMMAATRMSIDIITKPNSIFSKVDYKEKRRIFSDILEASNVHNKDQEALIWEMFDALSEGTYIGFEDFKKGSKTVEEIVDYDPDTGENKTKTITYDAWNDVYGTKIPINEFYPETIWTRNLDDIHRMFWARELTTQQFQDVLGKYKNAELVKSAGHYREQDGFDWGISENVRDNNVQVLYFFDEVANKMGIWANLTELYYGPMPWNHGKLPIWIAQGEPINSQFLFGKSLPDKLMSMQDMNDNILDAMLDQLFMGLNSPIFVDGVVNLDDNFLEPNSIIQLEQGSKVQKSNLGNIDQTSFQMLSLLKQGMEQSSVSNQAQGIPSGGRKTKFEVQQLQEGATQIAGLFLQLFESGYARKYLLRLKNDLQLCQMPSMTKDGSRKYKYIELEGRQLANGRTGKRKIQIVGPGQAPTPEQMEEVQGKDYNPLKADFQPIFISKDYLKSGDMELDVKMVANSSLKSSEFARKQRAKEYFQITAENPMVDQQKSLENFTEAMEQPADLVKEPQPEGEDPMAAMMAEQGQQPKQNININEDLV